MMRMASLFVCKWFDKWFEARGPAWINTNQSPDALFLQIHHSSSHLKLKNLNISLLFLQSGPKRISVGEKAEQKI